MIKTLNDVNLLTKMKKLNLMMEQSYESIEKEDTDDDALGMMILTKENIGIIRDVLTRRVYELEYGESLDE